LLDLHIDSEFPKVLVEFLAIAGHQRSTHTNYLIRIVKERSPFSGERERQY
jgi:hypothetical protein